MGGTARGPRLLIYSHDTFGLGHLRRSRAIANRLVAANPDLSILIISGSPVIGNFEFSDGIDYVRVPGVVKHPNGDYSSLSLNVELDEAVRVREAIIRQTVMTFAPDFAIVDKEPTGFRGEIISALEILKARGAHIVLGVRDVMDDPALLVPEWERKGGLDALERYYDEIWVYGLSEIYEPLAALPISAAARDRMRYVGYLKRAVPRTPPLVRYPKITKEPFVLATTGGGGDGENLVDWVISAYEADPAIPLPALIVFGPFIARDRRRAFLERIGRLKNVDAIAFDPKLERLIERAAGVIAMGGYNTFCEILSLDKRAIIVPRTRPRREQAIRAGHAARLGLVGLLEDPEEAGEGPRDPMAMAAAIRALPDRPRPSQVIAPGLLDGLDRVTELAAGPLQRVRRSVGMGDYVSAAAE
jgi:predicted glycosyltransferase